MWDAWIGFNFSHSLGLILFGLIFGHLVICRWEVLHRSYFLILVGFLVLLAYVVLARVFPLPDRSSLLAYASSKAAVDMMTVRLANQIENLGIKVNAVDPGFTATEMNQYRGTRTVEEGAATPVRLALLPGDAPTGRVFGNDGPEPCDSDLVSG